MKKTGKNKTSITTAGITGQAQMLIPVDNTTASPVSERKPQDGQRRGYGIHKTAPNVPIMKPVSMVAKMDMITTPSFAVTGNDGLMSQQTC